MSAFVSIPVDVGRSCFSWFYSTMAIHLRKDGSRNEERFRNQSLALDFVRKLMGAKIPRIAIENPVSVISTKIRKPDQIVQPWMFIDEVKMVI